MGGLWSQPHSCIHHELSHRDRSHSPTHRHGCCGNPHQLITSQECKLRCCLSHGAHPPRPVNTHEGICSTWGISTKTHCAPSLIHKLQHPCAAYISCACTCTWVLHCLFPSLPSLRLPPLAPGRFIAWVHPTSVANTHRPGALGTEWCMSRGLMLYTVCNAR